VDSLFIIVALILMDNFLQVHKAIIMFVYLKEV